MDTWIGVAAILVGLASCFYGYPLFRIFLILAGLIYGYLLGQSFTPASQPWLALLIGVGAAVVLALLAYPLWSIGVIVIGAALGFMILGALGLALNVSPGAVILMGVLGAAVVGFLFYGVRDLFVMLATAFSGADAGGLRPGLAPAGAGLRGRAGQLPGHRGHDGVGRRRLCYPVRDVQRSTHLLELEAPESRILRLWPKELEERPGGNASLIAPIISEKFLAEQQFIPVKQMDLW